MNRAEALATGVKRYFTGRPCPRGHVVERMVSTRACTQCLYEKTSAWKEANPEKLVAYEKARYESRPEFYIAKAAMYRAMYPERVHETHVKYNATPEGKAVRAAWVAVNPEKIKEVQKRRYLRRTAQMPPWANRDTIEAFYAATPVGMTVAHVIPLLGKKVSGLHVVENLQYLTPKANARKGNKFEVQQ